MRPDTTPVEERVRRGSTCVQVRGALFAEAQVRALPAYRADGDLDEIAEMRSDLHADCVCAPAFAQCVACEGGAHGAHTF